jgi:hypothetical protein
MVGWPARGHVGGPPLVRVRQRWQVGAAPAGVVGRHRCRSRFPPLGLEQVEVEGEHDYLTHIGHDADRCEAGFGLESLRLVGPQVHDRQAVVDVPNRLAAGIEQDRSDPPE